jgi:catechol 2,3-dioxygenase-like lactoylglutathione lyase family enzyme
MITNANLTILVSDMNRAITFYAETLGLERGPQYGDEWAEIRAPGVSIGLHPSGKRPMVEHGRHMTIGLRVDDLDASVKQLEARGVRFTPAPADRGSRLAYFTDPDGNPLYLIELKWG